MYHAIFTTNTNRLLNWSTPSHILIPLNIAVHQPLSETHTTKSLLEQVVMLSCFPKLWIPTNRFPIQQTRNVTFLIHKYIVMLNISMSKFDARSL